MDSELNRIINDQTLPQPNVSQTEQTPPGDSASSPLSPNQKPKGNKGLLFEILFVLIVLILVFGVLNYFNILRLSEIFPNQLGFLPRKQSSSVAIVPPVRQSFPTFPPSPTDQAKQTLAGFLPTVLTPSLVPKLSQIIVTPDKHFKKVLYESWKTSQGTVSARFSILPDGKNVASLDIFVIKEESASPSSELAKTMISQVFIVTPKGIWGCKPIPLITQRTYCENFWEDVNGVRKGVAMDGPILLGERKPSSYSYCEHHKENIGLYAWKSCRSEFAGNGVK